MTTRASRTRAQQAGEDIAVLNYTESLLLAQAVWEHGTGSWSAIAKVLTKHPLISRPKLFFTTQSCHVLYDHLMKEAGLEYTEANNATRSSINRPLAEKFFHLRYEELHELILSEETKFKAIVSEIEEIRAGRWDDVIKAQITGVPLPEVGSDTKPESPVLSEAGAESQPLATTLQDDIFDGSDLSGATDTPKSLSQPHDDAESTTPQIEQAEQELAQEEPQQNKEVRARPSEFSGLLEETAAKSPDIDGVLSPTEVYAKADISAPGEDDEVQNSIDEQRNISSGSSPHLEPEHVQVQSDAATQTLSPESHHKWDREETTIKTPQDQAQEKEEEENAINNTTAIVAEEEEEEEEVEGEMIGKERIRVGEKEARIGAQVEEEEEEEEEEESETKLDKEVTTSLQTPGPELNLAERASSEAESYNTIDRTESNLGFGLETTTGAEAEPEPEPESARMEKVEIGGAHLADTDLEPKVESERAIIEDDATSGDEPLYATRRSTRRRRSSVSSAQPPPARASKLRRQKRVSPGTLADDEIEADPITEAEDVEMGSEQHPKVEKEGPSHTTLEIPATMRRRDGKRKASIAEGAESPREKKRARDDSEPVEEDEPGPSSNASRARRRGDRTEEQVALKRFQNVISMLHSQISQHRNGNIFHNPIKNSEAPDYHEIVKRPIDLKTIKMKVKDGAIANSLEYQRDIFLMFANALMYNRPGSDIHIMAEDMMLESEGHILTFRQTEGLVRGVHRI